MLDAVGWAILLGVIAVVIGCVGVLVLASIGDVSPWAVAAMAGIAAIGGLAIAAGLHALADRMGG